MKINVYRVWTGTAKGEERMCKVVLVQVLDTRGVFRPRQTRQLPRAVDLKGRLLSCQSY